MNLKLSKHQWEFIGKTAGWIKQASDFREVIINLDTMELIEAQGYVNKNNQNTWIVSYDNDILTSEGIYDKVPSGEFNNQNKLLIAILKISKASVYNAVTNSTISIEEFANKIIGEEHEFWQIVRQNNDVYDIEREIEKRDMEMGDDQQVGAYEKYGPDKPQPQY